MGDGGEGGPPIAMGLAVPEGAEELVIKPPLSIEEFRAAAQGFRSAKCNASDNGIISLGFIELSAKQRLLGQHGLLEF